MIRPNLHAVWRYRPRILTLIVFFVAAATIVLANLSYDEASVATEQGWVPTISYRSYGWPIIWHRVVLSFVFAGMGGYYSGVGWYYSAPRLVANLLVWLMLLTASSGACEWLLRRYRPRLRWNMSSTVAATGRTPTSSSIRTAYRPSGDYRTTLRTLVLTRLLSARHPGCLEAILSGSRRWSWRTSKNEEAARVFTVQRGPAVRLRN
ncbi:MAG TPA: hypothetical protein VHC22_16060 [Pirellulales bacterium]|nr:hypothetical protein [Pirellulales bacterium]